MRITAPKAVRLGWALLIFATLNAAFSAAIHAWILAAISLVCAIVIAVNMLILRGIPR